MLILKKHYAISVNWLLFLVVNALAFVINLMKYCKIFSDVSDEYINPADPTSNYGGQCNQPSKTTDYLSNCNYSAAYDLLNHIYGGNLKMPTSNTQQNGQLLKFGQDDFFYISTPAASSMDNVGYIYIPSGCADKSRQCKLHVAFHGCEMGQSTIGDTYVKHAGYNEVGELNDIIILYPQARKETFYPLNPHGCWDWWGYTTLGFATNLGPQPIAVKRMIDRVIGA